MKPDIKVKTTRPAVPVSSRSVTIDLPAALLEWIDDQAEAIQIDRSEMIRRLIEESRLDVPQELGRTRTAYHEAGHAVVARALGIPITLATVEIGPKSLGHVILAETPLDTHRRLVEKGVVAKTNAHRDHTAFHAHIRATMAGREAEISVLGFHHDNKGDRQDRRDVNKLTKWLDHRTRDQTLHNLRADTMQILWHFPRSVRRVAEALMQSTSLDQNQIDEIIAGTGEKLGPNLLRAFGVKRQRLAKLP